MRLRFIPVLALLAATAVALEAGQTKIVAFGDSTTAPRGRSKVYTHLLQKRLPAKGVPARVRNAGVPADTTATARARFDRDVLGRRPDIVIVQFGINDAMVDVWKGAKQPRVAPDIYRKNLLYFVETLRSRGAAVVLMTPNPMRWTDKTRELYAKPPYDPDDPEGFNVVLTGYVEIVREIAEKEKLPLIDVFEAFQEFAGGPEELLDDGMHPNNAGHELIADLLVPAIVKMAGPADPAPEE